MRHRLAHLPLPPSRLRSRLHLYCSSAMRLIACGLRLACLDQDRQSKFVLPLLPSRSLESLYSQDRESHTPPPNEPFQLRGLETSHGPVNYASASLTEEQVGNSTSDPDAPSWIESVDNCTWACERYLIFFLYVQLLVIPSHGAGLDSLSCCIRLSGVFASRTSPPPLLTAGCD